MNQYRKFLALPFAKIVSSFNLEYYKRGIKLDRKIVTLTFHHYLNGVIDFHLKFDFGSIRWSSDLVCFEPVRLTYKGDSRKETIIE